MSITKLCAMGNLDIEFNLVLRLSEAECFKFEINDINSPLDLKNIFYPEEEENNEAKTILIILIMLHYHQKMILLTHFFLLIELLKIKHLLN